MEKTRIERAIDYITALFQGNGDGHDLSHSLRVYKNAMSIAKAEGQGEEEMIALSALLHDCDDQSILIYSQTVGKVMPIPISLK